MADARDCPFRVNPCRQVVRLCIKGLAAPAGDIGRAGRWFSASTSRLLLIRVRYTRNSADVVAKILKDAGIEK